LIRSQLNSFTVSHDACVGGSAGFALSRGSGTGIK
jgi:hypothetical protein